VLFAVNMAITPLNATTQILILETTDSIDLEDLIIIITSDHVEDTGATGIDGISIIDIINIIK